MRAEADQASVGAIARREAATAAMPMPMNKQRRRDRSSPQLPWAVLALPKGSSQLQIKSLLHLTSAEGWEATAGNTFSKGSPVCTVSP